VTTYAEVFAGVYTAVAAHAQQQDAGNTDGIMALYTPDAVLEVPGMGVYEGAEAIRAAWDDWKPKGLQRHMPVNVVITDWDDEEAGRSRSSPAITTSSARPAASGCSAGAPTSTSAGRRRADASSGVDRCATRLRSTPGSGKASR
jgi:hypothetical protein